MAEEEQPAASVSSLRARFEQLQSPASSVSTKPAPSIAKPIHAAAAATAPTASASTVDVRGPLVTSSSSLADPFAKFKNSNGISRKFDSITDKKPAPPSPSRPHYLAPRARASTSSIDNLLSSGNDTTVLSKHNKESSPSSLPSVGLEKRDARLLAPENGTNASTLRPASKSALTPPPSRSLASSTATPPTAVLVESGVESSKPNTPSPPALNAKSTPCPVSPLATRPSLSGSSALDPSPASASTKACRKIPPPVPVSRNTRAGSPNPLLALGHETAPSSSTPKAPTPENSSTPPPITSGDASVVALASKFNGPQWLRPRAVTESGAPTMVTSMDPEVDDPSGSKLVNTPDHSCGYSDEDEENDDACRNDLDDESERLRSENPEDLRGPQFPLKARPVVPPRPNIGASSYPPASSGAAARSATSPVSAKPLPPPTPTRLSSSNAEFDFTRSASSSTSSGSVDLPPPPRKIVPPTKKLSDPIRLTTKVPTRAVNPVTAPSSSPQPFLLSEPAYIPPPPPARSLAVSERLAPLRPAIPSTSEDGGNSSDEGDDDSSAYAKAQELPDATFANRRPPTLRNRRSIHPQGQFYSFTVRGTKLVTGQHHVYIWGTEKNSTGADSVTLPGEHKVYALEFTPDQDARYIWAGTKEGHLFEVDIIEKEVTMIKHHVHGAPVIGIYRCGNGMLTIDDNGKVLIWGDVGEPSDGGVRLSGHNKGQRVPDKQNFHAVIGTQLWTSSGPATKSGASAFAMRSPQIRVFDAAGSRPWIVLSRPLIVPDVVGQIGAVTASAVVPTLDQSVFLGHDNGYVSVWNRVTFVCEKVQRISPFKATAMVGVGKDLWIGYRNGMISVLDVSSNDVWMVKKMWKAHASLVTKLVIDPTSLWTDSTLQVASSGSDMVVHLWDGLLRDDWLDAEMHLRQRDYCTFRSIKTLCVSWNVDASRPGDLVGTQANLDFLTDVLRSVDAPDIISFGFQEMINLEDKKLTAKSMLLGKKKGDQKFADSVSSSYRVWHDKLVHAVRLAMPPESPYTVVHVGDMIGLFSCIFVKCSEAMALRDIAQITVKTGMGGRYGNKGAILARFVIDDTSICFINCHLAAGQTHRRQRDRDLVDILEEKSAFSELDARSFGAYALGSGGTTVFDHELVLLSGDLNYRIDARRDVVVQAVKEGNYASLLPYDQLLQGLTTNQTFRLRSFKEAPITFAPTYKYDPGTDEYDTSTKKRIPAWCDRILYRADRADKVTPLPDQYRRWEVNVSDHRPVSAAFNLRIKRIIPDKRALVWHEVEKAWKGVEESRLSEAKEYYRGW